jgi:hypothetical protein
MEDHVRGRKMLKRFLRMITQGEIGVTGLEIAVILITLMAVSGLSFWAAPNGLFAASKSQDVTAGL